MGNQHKPVGHSEHSAHEGNFGAAAHADTSTSAETAEASTAATTTAPVAATVPQPGPTAAQLAAQAAVASGTGGSKSGAKILLKDGTPRVDYIKRRFAEGASRSTITKEVNELRIPDSPVVPYQIIFAATKGLTQPGATAPAPALPAEVHPEDIAEAEAAEAEVAEAAE